MDEEERREREAGLGQRALIYERWVQGGQGWTELAPPNQDDGGARERVATMTHQRRLGRRRLPGGTMGDNVPSSSATPRPVPGRSFWVRSGMYCTFTLERVSHEQEPRHAGRPFARLWCKTKLSR